MFSKLPQYLCIHFIFIYLRERERDYNYSFTSKYPQQLQMAHHQNEGPDCFSQGVYSQGAGWKAEAETDSSPGFQYGMWVCEGQPKTIHKNAYPQNLIYVLMIHYGKDITTLF